MDSGSSAHELTQLIYRHLKEHGFSSAADELRRHNPQEDTQTSVSLLDIYKTWLRISKKKQNSAKRSTSGKKKGASGKDKSTSPKKKTDSPAKKTVKAKQKKGAGRAPKDGSSSKKSKSGSAVEAVGDEGSDSDSSLDVEKWKKIVQQMTEADLAKMELINTLDSSKPKKKRIRKPRVKPLAKTNTPNEQNQSLGAKEEITVMPAKKNTTRRKKSASVSSSGTLKETETCHAAEDEAVALSPSKQAEETVNTPAETAAEPKKNMRGESNLKKKDHDMDGQEKERSVATRQKDQKPVEENNKSKVKNVENEDDLTGNKVGKENVLESILKEKKAKKRKKETNNWEEPLAHEREEERVKKKKKKAENEGDSKHTTEKTKESADTDLQNEIIVEDKSEQSVESKNEKKKKLLMDTEIKSDHPVLENTEQNVQNKKGKKKKRLLNTEISSGPPVTENIEQNVEEHTRNSEQKKLKKKKIKTAENEDNSEHAVKEKKAKKKKREDNENSEEIIKTPKKVKKHTDRKTEQASEDETTNETQVKEKISEETEPSAPGLETSPQKKKKKKTKEKAEQLQDDSATEAAQISFNSHKKKKKIWSGEDEVPLTEQP